MSQKNKKKSSCKSHNVHGIRRMSKEKVLFKIDWFDLISVAIFFFLLSLPHCWLHLRNLKTKFNSSSFDFKAWIHAQQSNVQQGWKDSEFLRSVLVPMVRIDHIQRIKIKHFCWFFWKLAKLLQNLLQKYTAGMQLCTAWKRQIPEGIHLLPFYLSGNSW